MKRWIVRTQKLLDLAAEAEGSAHALAKLVAEEDSLLGLLWDGVISESMPKGMTIERIEESLTSLRDELTHLVYAMKNKEEAE